MENTKTISTRSGALKSDDQLRAYINKNFIIRWRMKGDKKSNLISAGKFVKLLQDKTSMVTITPEETKQKYFDKVINGRKYRYDFLIMGILQVQFISK